MVRLLIHSPFAQRQKLIMMHEATGYKPTAIEDFFGLFPDGLASLLRAILDLLSLFVRHSRDSGLTPHALGSIFGPLFFGLRPSNLPQGDLPQGDLPQGNLPQGDLQQGDETSTGVGMFEETYEAFVGARGAMVHLVLAFVRCQRAGHDRLTGDFPRMLEVWIGDYPHCLAHPFTTSTSSTSTSTTTTARSTRHEMKSPTNDVEGKIKVTLLRRTVRSYSPDLLTSHTQSVDDRWATWRDLGNEPRITAAHCLKLGIRAAGAATGFADGKEMSAATGKGTELGKGKEDGGWSAFEDLGFSEGEFADRLRFDLGEGAKRVRLDFCYIVNSC